MLMISCNGKLYGGSGSPPDDYFNSYFPPWAIFFLGQLDCLSQSEFRQRRSITGRLSWLWATGRPIPRSTSLSMALDHTHTCKRSFFALLSSEHDETPDAEFVAVRAGLRVIYK